VSDEVKDSEIEPFEYGIELVRHAAQAASWTNNDIAGFLYEVAELRRLCEQAETDVAQSLIDEGRVGEFEVDEGRVLVVRDRKQVGKNRFDHETIRRLVLAHFCKSDDPQQTEDLTMLFGEFLDLWTTIYTTPPSRPPSRGGLAKLGILAEEHNRGGDWVDDAYVRVLHQEDLQQRRRGNQQRNNRIAAVRAVENEVGF